MTKAVEDLKWRIIDVSTHLGATDDAVERTNYLVDAAKLVERERIIALLEAEKVIMRTRGASFGTYASYDKGYYTALSDMIALIKGERENGSAEHVKTVS